jgi:anti-sigma regulatory factor (Ser/Thr protein kinase)
VGQARRELTRHLSACGFPRADDAVLVVSEFASNAVLYSDSNNAFFTVRTELFPAYLWLEVEDLGGHWELKLPDPCRPHGLDIVGALTGPDGWGVDETGDGTRVVWARLEIAP